MSGDNVLDFDATVARLAVEGVPVCAIARATVKQADVIRDILDQAIRTGTIAEIPKQDWPGLSSNTSRLPALKQLPLPSDEQFHLQIVRTFHVTRLHARLLAVLLRRPEATKEMLHAAAENNGEVKSDGEHTDKKIVDVVICHLRKRLAPYSIEIKTLWAVGYCIDPQVRARALKMLEQPLENVVVLEGRDLVVEPVPEPVAGAA